MTLSSLFRGNIGPAVTSYFTTNVTNQLVTSSPAILMSATSYSLDSSIIVYNGSSAVVAVKCGFSGGGAYGQHYDSFSSSAGIDCPNGIRVTSVGTNNSIHYILK